MEVEIDSKIMFYIGGSGGAPASPHPPRELGLRPRGGWFDSGPAGRPFAPSKMKFPIVFRMRAAGSHPEFKPVSRESAISSAYPRDANSR